MASRVHDLLVTARTLQRDFGFARACRMLSRKVWRKLRHGRPPNTIESNLEVWETHDWSKAGEEWTSSPEWKQAVLDEFLTPHIPKDGRILEIGPGAGRWTEHLIPLASHLTLVDLAPACIELCRKRFGPAGKTTFVVNDGRSLTALPDASIDAVWSFDTFVHIDPRDVRGYMAEFARVMAPGATAVIHHARSGSYRRSWRSDMTAERMRDFCAEHRFAVVKQQDSLRNGEIALYQLPTQLKPDVVTVFRKPA